MNRGSRAQAERAVRNDARFNEAPIHESGKSEDSGATAGRRQPLQ